MTTDRTTAGAAYARSRAPRAMQPLSRLLMVVTLSLMVAGLFVYIGRMAHIAQQSRQLDQLRSAIQELTVEKQYLEIALATRQNLDRVRDVAVGQLGMRLPTDEQIRVVTLPSVYSVQGGAQAMSGDLIELAGDGSGM